MHLRIQENILEDESKSRRAMHSLKLSNKFSQILAKQLLNKRLNKSLNTNGPSKLFSDKRSKGTRIAEGTTKSWQLKIVQNTVRV